MEENNKIDKKSSKLENAKNEIVIISGIVSALAGLSGFVVSNLYPSIIPEGLDNLGWVLGFSAACFGVGKFGKS